MLQYVQVAEEENDDEPIELPTEEDGTLTLSTLAAQYPGACGLKYRNPETGAMRGIRLVDGRLHPPDSRWGSILFICVFPKGLQLSRDDRGAYCIDNWGHTENKRKGDDGLENPTAKTKRVEKKKCSDLIVLGLPWKSAEDDVRKYFEQFGEVIMVQIKRDLQTRQSKGYGFIRFADYESQRKCLKQRHMIDGRWCEVRIPNSKVGTHEDCAPRKVFVGRTTEEMTADDLRTYFSDFGEVIDVFIPKPFRAFAFVTFADSDVAQGLLGEDHIIKGVSVHVSQAAPKNYDKNDMRKQQQQQQQQQGGGGYDGPSGYSRGCWNQGRGGQGPGGNMASISAGNMNAAGGGGAGSRCRRYVVPHQPMYGSRGECFVIKALEDMQV
ncbi:TAR DNA-binding protein 43-like isoform X2 [Tubulanus polymorphus]|uniref:TAR DNA-binding protein 43-like isoform X2 n=1 Tax=Tubulanus polymorphus TaxID=672921 RepID=UPI003DA4D3B9